MNTPSEYRPSRMAVEGTYNFREAVPGLLAPGRLYRSDALHRLTPAGRAALRELGIARVVDLRSPFDRRLSGRDRLRGVGAEYVSIPMLGLRPKLDPSGLTLRGVYHDLLADPAAEVGTAITAVADAPGPVLVHCTAGKDRTGLVTALVLLAIGLDEDRVVADFAASADNLAGEWTQRMLRRARWFRVTVTDDLREIMAGSPEAALTDTLRWIDLEYGGVGAYLEQAGVGPDVVERLRETYGKGPR